MFRLAIAVKTLAVAGLMGLCSCQFFGPNSISQGRDRYNNIIQSTAMEQTLSNIVRVYQHEPTLFMDVSEVDATVTVGGSLTGAATNIGAGYLRTKTTIINGQVGSTGGTIQYSETPTIRYLPLAGQPLVAQLVTPVSVDALGLLYDSSWPIAPLLEFGVAYLTLDYDEFYSALNTIVELDDKGGIQIAAGKSDLPKPMGPEGAVPTPSATGPASGMMQGARPTENNNDSLVFYLRPFHVHALNVNDVADKRRILQLWVRLLRMYLRTQPVFSDVPSNSKCSSLQLSVEDPAQLRDWDVNIQTKREKELEDARECLPRQIELRVVPAPARREARGGKPTEAAAPAAPNLVSRAPLMRTYSALGMLKAATERPHPKIEFVTPARYREIRDPSTHGWNADPDALSYYTLLPQDEDSIDCPDTARSQKGGCDNPAPGGFAGEEYKQISDELARWIADSVKPSVPASTKPPTTPGTTASDEEDPYHGLLAYEQPGHDALEARYVRFNERLGLLRRYILVVVADALPPDVPYVSYAYAGRWYYIAGDDTISKKNFHLLSLFLTMMAVPPATQPLSPVINVGG